MTLLAPDAVMSWTRLAIHALALQIAVPLNEREMPYLAESGNSLTDSRGERLFDSA